MAVGKFQIIDNTSGTTTNVAELKADITSGTYTYNCVLGAGLRVVISGDVPITVTYKQ